MCQALCQAKGTQLGGKADSASALRRLTPSGEIVHIYHVPGTCSNALNPHSEVGTLRAPNLWMRKFRHREVR